MTRSIGILLLVAAAIALLTSLARPATTYTRNDFAPFRAGAEAVLEGASPYDAAW